MKLKDIAEVIKGIHLLEGDNKNKWYKELSMLALEPISFLDERKLLSVKVGHNVSAKQLTRVGDVIVSLYSPMIACYVEKGQAGYVVPHYMAIVRLKSHQRLDSRFVVHFINSTRGRRALFNISELLYSSKPTSLPLVALNEVELLTGSNQLMEKL